MEKSPATNQTDMEPFNLTMVTIYKENSSMGDVKAMADILNPTAVIMKVI
jgi:hypothetical protein